MTDEKCQMTNGKWLFRAFLTLCLLLLYSAGVLAISNKTKLLAATLVVYIGVVFAFTIVPTHLSGFRNPRSYHINVSPLGYSFTCFLKDPNQHPHITTFCLRNTLGNLALFVPLGILLPLVSKRFQSFKRVLLSALMLSVSVEAIQFLLRFFGNPRAVDIDDVILNALGACVGFAIYKSLLPMN
jgi:glycopeptide antibiotics resistance protein